MVVGYIPKLIGNTIRGIIFAFVIQTMLSTINGSNLRDNSNIRQYFKNELKTSEPVFSLIQSKKSKICRIKSDDCEFECVPLKDLEQFRNTLTKTFSKVLSKTQQNACKLNLKDSDDCKQLLKFLSCEKDLLIKEGLKNKDAEEIQKWFVALKKFTQDEFNTFFTSYYRKILNNDEVSAALQNIVGDLGKLLEVLSVLSETKQSAMNVHVCAQETITGETAEAVQDFEDLKLIKISKIVEVAYLQSLYGKNELKKFRNIINFIILHSNISYESITIKAFSKIHSKQSDAKIAYEILFKKMAQQKDTSFFKFVLLENAIRNLASEIDEEKHSSISSNVRQAKSFWVNEILDSRINETLINFAKNYPNHFNDILSDILRIVSEDDSDPLTYKFDEIESFIQNLPHKNQIAIAYSTLVTELKKRDLDERTIVTMRKLATSVKEFLAEKTYLELNEENNIIFKNLKFNFPDWTLIWNVEKCKIKSRKRGEYLIADVTHDSDHRKVSTWQFGTYLIGIREKYGLWQIETDDTGETFKLKNVHWNEYLYVAEDSYGSDEERYRVFTWINKTRAKENLKWVITPVDANYITLENTRFTNEFLYSDEDEFDSQRRDIYTYVKETSFCIECRQWILECE